MTALMEVWLTGLELDWLLQTLRDVLDKHFRATTGQKILPVWVEFKRLNGHSIVDLSGRDASLAHQLLRFVLGQELFDVPEGDSTVLHSTSDNSELIDLINPIESGEFSWAFSDSNHFYQSKKAR